MFRASSSSQTLSDGRNELPELSESSVRGSPHGIPDVEEEQGDVQGHDQIREDNEMGEEDEPDDSADDEDSVGVHMLVHGGGGRPPRRRKFMPIWRQGRPWLMHIALPSQKPYMKCAACQAGGQNTRWGTRREGCESLQLSAVKEHEGSTFHSHAILRWRPVRDNPEATAMARHVVNAIDAESARIICCMKILYHLVVNDRAINQYEDMCHIIRHLRTPDMPVNDEYGAYTSRQSAYDFLWAISQHLREVDLLEVKDSPVISLLVDESTDRSLEQHLIVYVCSLSRGGLGPPRM
jgi:hypothetical protein